MPELQEEITLVHAELNVHVICMCSWSLTDDCFGSAPALAHKLESSRGQIANTAEVCLTKTSVDDPCMKNASKILYWGGGKCLRRVLNRSIWFLKLYFYG